MLTTERLILFSLWLMAAFYAVSGIALYFSPQQTFESLPAYYGDFNIHFVKDAGIAFFSSGLMLAFAAAKKALRLTFCLCASLFVVLHGLFHVQMIVGGMVPTDYLPYELVQIILPASLLLVLLGVIYATQRQ